ncbi:DUF2092 domain-containing protein [Polycladidibacter stylochi]|uniref:DUF2092 domain-containing protein n=1 Tax=Polycladidibacter stylochi TaxID=1807766 RepID=UPI0008326C3C|nr:DUF2092 domain-containing protein [Pseudovibrio stylochi]
MVTLSRWWVLLFISLLYLTVAIGNARAKEENHNKFHSVIKATTNENTERNLKKIPQRRDIQAIDLLKSSLLKLEQQKAMKLDVFVSDERVFKGNIPINFVYEYQVAVEGDSKIRLTFPKASGKGILIYAHGIVTYFDAKRNLYTQGNYEGTLGGLMDELSYQFQLRLPGVELLKRNTSNVIDNYTQSAFYIGREKIIEGIAHHLAFFNKEIDWQIWIDERTLLPLYVILTHKHLKGQPQTHLHYKNWYLGNTLNEDLFEFIPPDGAVDYGQFRSRIIDSLKEKKNNAE